MNFCWPSWATTLCFKIDNVVFLSSLYSVQMCNVKKETCNLLIKRTFIHYHKLQQPFNNYRYDSLGALKAILKYTADILQNEHRCLQKKHLKETQKGQQDCPYYFCVLLRCLFFLLEALEVSQMLKVLLTWLSALCTALSMLRFFII